MKENAKLVEEFKESNDRKMVSDNDAFQKVVAMVEAPPSQVCPPMSDVFATEYPEDSDGDLFDDSSDDEFEVQIESYDF